MSYHSLVQDHLQKSGNKYKFEYKFVLINKDFVFKKIILTTDGTDFTVFKATGTILHSMATRSYARWPTDKHTILASTKW